MEQRDGTFAAMPGLTRQFGDIVCLRLHDGKPQDLYQPTSERMKEIQEQKRKIPKAKEENPKSRRRGYLEAGGGLLADLLLDGRRVGRRLRPQHPEHVAQPHLHPQFVVVVVVVVDGVLNSLTYRGMYATRRFWVSF